MMHGAKILIIDDEESIRVVFSRFLAGDGYNVATAGDYDSALKAISGSKFDLIFADILLGNHSGVDILKEIHAKGLLCPVIMITGVPSIDTAADALRLGAFDYLPKPIKKETLLRVTKHALQHKALLDEKTILETEKERYRANLEAIFRSVRDAIITVDMNMRVIEVNNACKCICGVCPQKEMDFKTYAKDKSQCNKICCKMLAKTLETKSSIKEYRIECGHYKRPQQVVVLNTSPLKDYEGNFIGAVLSIRDVTRLSYLESKLRDRYRFRNIIGKNNKMQEIYTLIEDLKDMDTTVLVTGESGTGKELVAKALHYSGIRGHKPFVAVNCSALAENLLESELFGHVKGAFTGAIKTKQGRFEMANHGTIFLDEIGDISPRIQLKLLRVLEEREFEMVGDSTPKKVNVRVIAATNRDLKEMVMSGDFREDFYYRLKVVTIKIPPLRERRDDIPLFIEHFISFFNKHFNKDIKGISSDAERALMEYPWPGNVRELQHSLEHAFVICHGKTITLDDLPHEIRDALPKGQMSKKIFLTDERQDIIDVMEQTGWNKAKTARVLGISRQTIYRKIQQYNICNT